MKRIKHKLGGLLALMLLLLTGPALGQALQPPAWLPVSAHARRLFLAAQGQAAVPRGAQKLMRNPQGEPVVPLTVQALGGAASLLRAGIPARELSPSFAAVALPPARVPELYNVPGLVRVDGARVLYPRLNRSVPLIGASRWHDLGVYGKNVVVAVIDTGIDFRHADFRNSDGSSRILYLVDALTPRGTMHPELPDTGGMAVYTQADLNSVLAAEAKGQMPPISISEADNVGHGTHVAGIAAGNGMATGNGFPAGRYVGMAPEAGLCVVKATRDEQTFLDMDILTGVSFCVAVAASLNLPVAVNLSIGSAGGPHDGSSALEMALDELMNDQPGRALAVAAGNDGGNDIHASSVLLDGTHEVSIKVTGGGQLDSTGMSSLALELFFDTAAPQVGSGVGQIDLDLLSPSGKVLHAGAGQASQGDFTGEGMGVVDNSDPTIGLRSAVVLINGESQGTSLPSGQWTLRISGTTLRYDLWMVEASDDLTVNLGTHLDPDLFVEIPAAATSAISVGAMRSRDTWQAVDGTMIDLGLELFRVAPFSSSGPTSDGRFSPDILAPGEFLISSLSSSAPPTSPLSVFANPGAPALLIADDGVHGILRGTSQATPHVTGAIALIFGLHPSYTATHVRELLRTTGDIDPSLPSYGPRRGFGTLNMGTVLQTLSGPPPGALDTTLSDLGSNFDAIAPVGGQAVISVTPRDSNGVPLGPGLQVEVTTDAGTLMGATVDTGFGRYEQVLAASGPRGTQATIKAQVGGVTLDRSLIIRFIGDSSDTGTPFVVAGCALAGAPSGARRVPGPPVGRGAQGFLICALAVLLFRRRATVACAVAAGSVCSLDSCREADSLTQESPPFPDTAGGGAASRGARVPRFPVGGDYYWQGGDRLEHPSVVIHLEEQIAEIFDGEELVARSSVCTGRRSRRTPTGRFSVQEKIPEHVSGRYGDYVDEAGRIVQANVDTQDEPPPPGTAFRGIKMPFFLRIVGGIGLHAGPLPGHPDSHGCIRLPPFIAQRLFNATSVGMPVTVQE